MMKMTLHDQERQPLEPIVNTTPDRRLRTRCQAMLMAARGRPHRQTAEDLRISARTLPRWWHTYQEQGLDGLKMHWVPGRRAKIPETWAPEILGGITQGPAGCGLGRANWAGGELATSLSQPKGLAVSTTTMRTCCQRHGVRPYRPTSHDLKAEPGQQGQARQDLQAFKKRPKRAHSSW